MALAAGLRVVERAQAIGSDVFDLLKEFLVGLAPIRIRKAVALVIEAGERFRCLRGGLSPGIETTQDRTSENERPQGRRLHQMLLFPARGFASK